MDTKPTILIAEDDPSHYRYLEVILRKDYNLLWAQNGQQAIDMALGNDVSVVLMDYRMPEMTGVEALTFIKKKKPWLPIVMQTAFAFEADRNKAISAGADFYLTKPIRSAELRNLLSTLFAGMQK